MKKIITLMFSVLLVLALAACSNETADNTGNDGDTLTIYTTVFPLKSFVEQIGGDTVEVETIYPNGVDVHSYEPTQREMIEYADGDLFVYTTDTLDPVAEKIKSAVGDHSNFFAAAGGISEEDYVETHHDHDHGHGEEAGGHDHGSEDPHIWLDPMISLQMAEAVKDQLIEMNPGQKALYNENFEILKNDIEALDAEFKAVTESPKRNSVYISHESLGYLAARYHFNQVGITGLNNQKPSQQELTEIIENVEAQDVPYILYEQNLTSKIADTIRRQTDTEPLEFHNLSVLTDKDPGDATYQSFMRENAEVLDKALNE
ncbi:metal ABC transporter solute-binding protein, Zn/Mn family [Salinicoccus sp. HZC-1]|uniref:metal ABC transporter solute-binding protein, Zn/Mn family n=1 Tax=Salinicoccus sp. HZC-1 TaxID=3385497 RepID=UPI00398B45D6